MIEAQILKHSHTGHTDSSSTTAKRPLSLTHTNSKCGKMQLLAFRFSLSKAVSEHDVEHVDYWMTTTETICILATFSLGHSMSGVLFTFFSLSKLPMSLLPIILPPRREATAARTMTLFHSELAKMQFETPQWSVGAWDMMEGERKTATEREKS